MATEYEIEHNLTDENPMGLPPNATMLRLFNLDNMGIVNRDQLSIYEALLLGPQSEDDNNSALKSMKRLKVESVESQMDKEAQCNICLELISKKCTEEMSGAEITEQDRSRLIVMPCDHKFHILCINEWLKRKNTCPACRTKLKSDLEYEEEERQANLDELHDSMFS